MTLILAREIGALLGARVELPGMSENPAWTSPTAIVGTLEGVPSDGAGDAGVPTDTPATTKQPPYGVNELVRLVEVDETCHGEASLDLDGPALTWGLNHKASSA